MDRVARVKTLQPVARRDTLKMLAALPLSAILADAALADSAACCLDEVTLTLSDGRQVAAAWAAPLSPPAPVVVLFHEWWGLNNQIKAVALDLAAKYGVAALAIDLYGRQVAETADKAQKLMQGLDPRQALQTTVAWVGWLRGQAMVTNRIATLGWCMGGGWSLNASLAEPMDATVIYYGNVEHQAAELKNLKGPVLGHFAKRDQWINEDMVTAFAAEMKKAGKELTAYWYNADHAFANPTGANYESADTALAWDRTTAFLTRYLRG